MSPRRSSGGQRLVALAGFALAVAVAVIVGQFVKDAVRAGPDDAVDAFLSDWSAGRDGEAAARTDTPERAARALRANRRGLDRARLRAEPLDVSEHGDSALAHVRLTWDVPAIGPWSYETRIALSRHDGEWTVRWRPQLVHPRLDARTRLGTTRSAPERAPILDRHGRVIVGPRPVVRVGAVVGDVSDPQATADGLAVALKVDAKPILRQLRGGGPKQFVEALVLRRDDYEELKDVLAGVPDVATFDSTAPLAPTREFARALLGTVAPATAEQLKRLGDRYTVGDQVGQWGLEARFERRLAGTPTRRIVIRTRGVPTETLRSLGGRDGRALATTLDTRVQLAAEAALGDRTDEAALVAVEPSTGDVLAVANRPVDSSFDRALEGRYPPGSTFKVVTTTALLRAGLRTTQIVPCPKTLVVQGKLFRNFEGDAAGPVPFSQDFAQSCNTAFIGLADRLDPNALTAAGRSFGLGRRLRLPVPAPRAQVPPGRTPVERAAAMIGQYRLLASPLSMAGVAATVAAGRWHAPRLLESGSNTAAPPLSDAERDTLATLMRSVVTSGTGTALAGVAGEPAGKSGTAEFGGADPPPTHAWFIAYRDDIALAVLVEHGRSGGSVAAPVAARFFSALDAPG